MSASECGGFALFDDDDGGAIVLTEYRRWIGLAQQSSDLSSVFAEFSAASARGEWLALAADYELGVLLEPAVARATSAALASSGLNAWVFGKAQRLDADGVRRFLAAHLASLAEHERICGVAELRAAIDAEHHARCVAQIKRWIVDGECYQINLTFPLEGVLYGHPLALYARLRERQPVRYGGFLAVPGTTVVSLSPELFFERRGRRVTTRPMKGTAPRGSTPHDDAQRRDGLLASAKESAENIMIVDLLRNDLGRLAAPGQVRVDALCVAEAYPTLWQLVSTVSADLPGTPLIELFRALFPCGSITGAPKIRAMQCIDVLEGAPRGLYTGALGWLAPDGDCRFNVAIRTLVVSADRQIRLGVGSGVVIDSVAASEYAECLLKSAFVAGLDPGFELVETLRLAHGEFPLLALHLERLQASAQALGFACDIAALGDALAGLAAQYARGVLRVRLRLAHDGDVHLSVAPFADGGGPWTVVLADEPLPPDDYLRRHKTTARALYERTLAALAADPVTSDASDASDVLDAIFVNTRGEVCEGARSNVYVERDGVLLTPPVSCGLLPGVMRRRLLESGRAREAILSVADLYAAPAIYLSNALRGLVPVSLRR